MKKHQRIVPAGEFKQHCLSLMDEVAASGTEMVITKRGVPICRLISLPTEKAKVLFGWMKGTAIIKGNIVRPTGAKWKANK